MTNHIRKVREGREMTVAELARQTGLSRRMIDYLERGERAPSLETAQRLAKALKCGIESLYPPDISTTEQEEEERHNRLVTSHMRFAKREKLEFYHLAQGVGDGYVDSKTSGGRLVSERQWNGKITHKIY